MWLSRPVSWHLSLTQTPERQSICRLRKMNLLFSIEDGNCTQIKMMEDFYYGKQNYERN